MSDHSRKPQSLLPQKTGAHPQAFLRPQHSVQNGVHQDVHQNTHQGVHQGMRQNNNSKPVQQLEALKRRRRRFDENRLFVVNGMTMRFSPDLAREIGDRESQLLLQYEFWIAMEGIELPDGRRCIQDSLRALHAFFNWWTYSTLQRTFDSVLAQGYLYTEPVPDARCQSGTNKNAGRLVFIHHGRCAQLQSIQVASRTVVLDPPEDDVPEDELENGTDENGVSTTPVYGALNGVSEAYHYDTPSSEVYQKMDGVYQNQAKVYHSDTPPIYKDCARGRIEEYKDSSSEERAGAPGSAREATVLPVSSQPMQTNRTDERTEDERRNFSNFQNGEPNQIDGLRIDDWGNLTCDDDVLGLLYAFGIGAQNIRHIDKKDWDEIPDAIRFMRHENLRIEDLEEYVLRSRKRFHAAYLSQFVKRFYQTMPHVAARKNAALRASQQPNSPTRTTPVAAITPMPQTMASMPKAPENPLDGSDETCAQETEKDRQRRVLYAAQTVFQSLPDAAATELRQRAEQQLPPLFSDRLRLARANHKEPGYSELRAIQETVFSILWQDQSALCNDALQSQPDAIEAVPLVQVSFLGLRYPALPALPDVLEQPSEGELDQAGLDQAGLDQAGLDQAGLDQAGLDQPTDLPNAAPVSNGSPHHENHPQNPPEPRGAAHNAAGNQRARSSLASGFADTTDVIGGVLRQMKNGGVSEGSRFRAA